MEKDHAENRPRKTIFECPYKPLWAVSGVKGRRSEMEDTSLAVPGFMELPITTLMNNAPTLPFTSVMGHLFGVFDGHGGSQVAEYCREHLCRVLKEELTCKTLESNEEIQAFWEKAFTECFRKLDCEVGGRVPHDMGSTAVVAIITCSHIILANCGDSRAVLSRGREAIDLSTDHKPDRVDEKSRIEAAGGTVIYHHGARVFGILAMSRAIGDLGLKDWVISDPEVKITPRAKEDNCLILGTDGFWDSFTSEEACSLARKYLCSWHRKNPEVTTNNGCDPASEATATFLTNMALKRGSSDNITIIVVDFIKGRLKN